MTSFPPAQLCLRVLSLPGNRVGSSLGTQSPHGIPPRIAPSFPLHSPTAGNSAAGSKSGAGRELARGQMQFCQRAGAGVSRRKTSGRREPRRQRPSAGVGIPGGEVPEWSDLGCPASLDLGEVPRK